jgi:hypothetical protein
VQREPLTKAENSDDFVVVDPYLMLRLWQVSSDQSGINFMGFFCAGAESKIPSGRLGFVEFSFLSLHRTIENIVPVIYSICKELTRRMDDILKLVLR